MRGGGGRGGRGAQVSPEKKKKQVLFGMGAAKGGNGFDYFRLPWKTPSLSEVGLFTLAAPFFDPTWPGLASRTPNTDISGVEPKAGYRVDQIYWGAKPDFWKIFLIF